MAVAEVLQSTGTDGRSFYRSLPREYYTSPGIFDKEFRKVFSRQWLVVGHVSQVRESGQFFTVDLAGENIIVTRGHSGALRAFYNVCRHRGSRICDAASGRVNQFVCPYHAWAYETDGALVAAPTVPDGEYMDYTELGLLAVRVAERSGFVFLHLGKQEPHPLADSFAPVAKSLERHQTDRLKLVHELQLVIQANWKLVLENNLECYHCRPNHPTLCGTVQIPGYYEAIEAGERWAIQDRNFVGGPGAGAPLREGWKSFTRDGQFASRKLLGRLTAADAGLSAGFLVGPVFGGALVFPDYIALTSMLPIDNDTTRHKVQWFVREDAVEGVDYDLARVIDVLEITTREDIAITERNARGVSSRAYVPGPLSKAAEPVNHLMFSLYLEWMAEQEDA